MRILVVGKGGREHALVRALAESPEKPELFCFPGSDAIFEIAKPIEADGLDSLIAWMKNHAIDLCVAGEESYRGTITSGKVADLVVLSQDIFRVDPMAILETQVEMTVLDGKVVWVK